MVNASPRMTPQMLELERRSKAARAEKARAAYDSALQKTGLEQLFDAVGRLTPDEKKELFTMLQPQDAEAADAPPPFPGKPRRPGLDEGEVPPDVMAFLSSKLSPADLAKWNALRTGKPIPAAADAKRIGMDIALGAREALESDFAKRFPEAARVKVCLYR